MRPSVSTVYQLVSELRPADELESDHRADVLGWLPDTDDVFRRVKPATPPKHLVSYVVPIDPVTGAVLLVDHINAGLWLPPGGHVEPDEHPLATARREAAEELGVTAGVSESPLFLTVTMTVGLDAGHTDVSLWFLLPLDQDSRLAPDPAEFHRVKWWSPVELAAADRAGFDPHFFRFLNKRAQDGF